MRLTVNGKPVDLAGPTPLLDYLAALGVDHRAVAVELNARILERGEFATAVLGEGDVAEIVRMVGGGAWRARGLLSRAGAPGSPPRPPRARPRVPCRRP
jgi:sulfur carrier protein